VLIYCPVCYVKISKKVSACPSCGHPIDENATNYDVQKALAKKMRIIHISVCIFFVMLMIVGYIIFNRWL